jgi:uncharacterized integral membrane protein
MPPKTAIPPSPPPPPLTRLAAEEARSRDEKRAVWGFIWILFGFKMATVIAIFAAAQTQEAAVLLAATTWFWVPIPIVALSGGLLFRYRLRKVRRRREALRRAEWLLEEAPWPGVPTRSR